MRTAARLCTCATLLTLVAIAGRADAQGVALSRFEPAPRGSRFVYADSLDLGRIDPSDTRPVIAAGLAMSWAARLNTWGNVRQGKRDTLVRNTTELQPSASASIAPGARFSLAVPIVAFQNGEGTTLDATRYPAPLAPALGDIKAGFDLRFLGPTSRDAQGFTLAGGVNAWLPTGTSAAYTSDDFTRFGVHVASAMRHRWLLVAASAGYMYRRDAYLGGARVGPEVNGVLGVAAMFKKLVVGPELVASSSIYTGFAKRSTPVELVLAAHNDIGPIRLGGGVSLALVPGLGSANVRSIFTVEWIGPDANETLDRDRDGVPDAEDLCPDLPGDGAHLGCPVGPPPAAAPPPPLEPDLAPPAPPSEPPPTD